MSRILRRPMFRGGSANEGIMSVPRKSYGTGPDEGGVQGFNLSNYGYPYDQSNEENEYTQTSLSTNDSIDLNKINNLAKTTAKEKNIPSDKLKDLSTSDILMAEYLGNRPDPLGKFLINFGLNYMSARPRGGKFGALTTAAEAAKKPTEQLYSDIDTDRLLKLKLMSALGKSETAGSFEKRVKAEFKYDQELPEGERRFKTISDAAKYVSRLDAQKKQQTVEEKINEEYKNIRSKAVSTGSEIRDMNKAEILQRDKNKLKNEVDKLASTNTFGIPDNITKLPNSTDYSIPNAKKTDLDSFKVGRIYVDSDTRMSFEYLGNNIFRPKMKL